ncbi:60s acidic ribosomal protein domain-containing protein [Purpureocillium lavendulum]|uniref:60s acidic ribosomal protein domain-containing protein n=1 Tax=Purpureocillium lavendulum TaxID=1247861 RepID=A0AB34G0B5_9HYPO|nr:60s acidic ribosomal protein domain-containing protein [Purpureocillium lavendulum]
MSPTRAKYLGVKKVGKFAPQIPEAYLLLGLGGNASPSAADVKKVLSAVGIEADDERLNKLISELKGKDINELIAAGTEKLASVPSGGAGGAPAAGGAAAGGAAAEAKAEEKEEEKEESDEDMGFGLFD